MKPSILCSMIGASFVGTLLYVLIFGEYAMTPVRATILAACSFAAAGICTAIESRRKAT